MSLEMDMHKITVSDWTRHLYERVLVVIAPGHGRRRVWAKMTDLESQLAAANQRITELENEANDDKRLIVRMTHELDQSSAAIKDLNKRLYYATEANIANELMISFDMMSRPVDVHDPLDQATSPIDVRELREVLSRDEPLTSRVLQVGALEGAERVTETHLDPQLEVQTEVQERLHPGDVRRFMETFERMGHRVGRVTITGRAVRSNPLGGGIVVDVPRRVIEPVMPVKAIEPVS